MRMLIREGDEVIDTRMLGPSVVTLGSSVDCDVTLADRLILPKQAALAPAPSGGWVIEVSPEGPETLLNGRPLTQPTPINHGDEVRIGAYLIAFVRTPDDRTLDRPTRQVAVPAEVSKLRAFPLPPGAVAKKSPRALQIDENASARLARFAAELRRCPDIPRLIDHVLESVVAQLLGRMAYLGTRRNNYGMLEFVQGRQANGRSVGEPPSFEPYAYRCLERSQFILVPSLTHAEIGSVLAVPLACGRGTLGVLYVDRKKGALAFTEEDLDLLTMLADLAAVQLELIVEKQLGILESITAGELAFLREIQARMDPARAPQWSGYQMAVYCKPGQERSGDIFDVLSLPNGFGSLFVAHVTGEGVSLAVAMAYMRSACRYAVLHLDGPQTMMRAANWMLCEERAGCRMQGATVIINPATGDLEHCIVGDIGALIVDRRGNARMLSQSELPAAGSVPGVAYESGRAQLLPGETLALFTLGCQTVSDANGEPLGLERLTESLCDGYGQTATAALDELVQDLAPFFKHGHQPDDITILLLHRVPSGP